MTLKELYYNPKSGYTSITKFYKKAKEEDPSITLKDVQDFLNKQETYQLNKHVVKPKDYSTIVANKIKDNYQIDIIVYDRYTIDKYKYILCVVDVHSRYSSCRAMMSRYNITIELNLISIFKEMGIPRNINADNEFNTKPLNKLFDELNITCHFSEVGEINKNAIVERFNRTLALLFNKWREATGKKKWYKVLNDVVYNYNHSYHRTIKATPYDVWKGIDTNKQSIKVVDYDFKVGDRVRIKLAKKIFDKGDLIKYSKEIFLIKSIDGNKITLDGGERIYKPFELVKVENVITLEKEEPIKEVVVKNTTQYNKAMKEIKDYLKAPATETLPEKRIRKPNTKYQG